MAKRKTCHPEFLCHPGCQLPALFRILAPYSHPSVLLVGSIPHFTYRYWSHSFLLYDFLFMYPSLLRVYSGYICPETIIPAGLFQFFTLNFCRLYDCNSADLIYYLPHCTRIFVRYGYGRGKHAGYRHHAVFPTGRRIGLLRTDQ